jgi:transcriptional regulator with XRE-family HTH domain
MHERFAITSLIKRLVAKRKEAGLSTTELARHIGVNRRTLSDYENGNREPRLEFLDTWAKGLGAELALMLLDDSGLTPAQEDAMARALPLIRQIPADRLGMAIALLEAAAKP